MPHLQTNCTGDKTPQITLRFNSTTRSFHVLFTFAARSWAFALIAAYLFEPWCAFAYEVQPQSPQEVWAGYDPRAEPLEVEVLREWKEHGANWREFYFTGETFEGEKVRVYAMYSAPEGAQNLPGMLHIHGGGQTVNPAWNKLWNERGYAAMTYNWGGRWENRERYTLWGKLTIGNHLDAKDGRQTQPTVRASSWYHWTLVSRRALTYLEQQPEVDPERLGIFGISMGGTITWPFAAIDSRVKAACAIYGNGWSTYPGFGAAGNRSNKLPDEEIVIWRKTMEPEAYAPFITCPLLFLSSTNDHHGLMDRAYDSLALVKGPYRAVFTPKYTHHVEPDQGASLPIWMDRWLKNGKEIPRSPIVEIQNVAGRLSLSVSPDRGSNIESIRMHYSIENEYPITRFWRDVISTNGKPESGALDYLDANRPVYAFANVFYADGLCLSSNLAVVVPAKLNLSDSSDEASLLIDDFADGYRDWIFVPAYTDPTEDWTYLRLGVGPDGTAGLTLNPNRIRDSFHIGTNKPGDPKWRGPVGAKLAFSVQCTEPNQLSVDVIERQWQFESKTFTAQIVVPGGKGWREIVVSTSDFLDDGVALANWNAVDRLELRAKNWKGDLPLFGRFRWIPDSANQPSVSGVSN
jgi:dienelactone hydrolase